MPRWMIVAVRDAMRDPANAPDALEYWRSTMPEKEKPVAKQEERRKPTATELKLMALSAEIEQHKRKAAQERQRNSEYRDALEKAIGQVIRRQQDELAEALKQIDCLRTELDLLRSTLPVRLVQPTIGRAAGA